MGIIYNLWIDVDNSKQEAEKLLAYFSDCSVLKIKEKAYKIKTYNQGGDVVITADEISQSGPYSKQIANELSSVGFALLHLLKNQRVAKYRFSLIGCDVEQSRELEDFKDEPEDYYLKGATIHKDLFKSIGSPKEFESFNEEYYWKPYDGIKKW